MPWDTRVFKKRHLPEKTTIIGATNPHPMGFNYDHPGARLADLGNIYDFKDTGFLKSDCFHDVVYALGDWFESQILTNTL